MKEAPSSTSSHGHNSAKKGVNDAGSIRQVSGRENVQLIKESPFFRGIDWSTIGNEKSKPPFIPKLHDETDTSYFDTDQQSSSTNNSGSNHNHESSSGKLAHSLGPLSDEEEKKVLELRKELAFVGFAFRGYPNAYKMRQRYLEASDTNSKE